MKTTAQLIRETVILLTSLNEQDDDESALPDSSATPTDSTLDVAPTTVPKVFPEPHYNPYMQWDNPETDKGPETSPSAGPHPEVGSEPFWKEYRAFGTTPPGPIPTDTYPTMPLPIPSPVPKASDIYGGTGEPDTNYLPNPQRWLQRYVYNNRT